ncbi:uncharacterized protein M6B38_285765 [Iris pallida]|uniref:Uncharacterized protein n=1 Tax=Iris pallida TaxID=29817 RepID=A0AAX6HYD1_IRIPA|nr:uncharacterized protein M6B38_285765 [Iris pallida]
MSSCRASPDEPDDEPPPPLGAAARSVAPSIDPPVQPQIPAPLRSPVGTPALPRLRAANPPPTRPRCILTEEELLCDSYYGATIEDQALAHEDVPTGNLV